MSEFDDMLSYDPLLEAERVTGKSYKDDELTSSLGLFLHLEHNKRKAEELGLRDDTHFGSSFADTLRIYREEGFEVVHEHDVAGTKDRYVVLWSPEGFLATLESYWDGESVNMTKVHFNFESTPESWKLLMSHGPIDGHDKMRYGDMDMREGLRHNLARLRELNLLNPWLGQGHLWLMDYQQTRFIPKDWTETKQYREEINNSIISNLPEHVLAAITPKDTPDA